jgi:hypothetical protein
MTEMSHVGNLTDADSLRMAASRQKQPFDGRFLIFKAGAWPWGQGVICETVERSLAQRGYDMRPIVVA